MKLGLFLKCFKILAKSELHVLINSVLIKKNVDRHTDGQTLLKSCEDASKKNAQTELLTFSVHLIYSDDECHESRSDDKLGSHVSVICKLIAGSSDLEKNYKLIGLPIPC